MTHRGVVHTVWFALAVGGACAVAFAVLGAGRAGVPSDALAVFGFAVGGTAICSHLAVDALTPMGVAPLATLYPRRHSLRVTRSADRRANRRFLLAGLVATALAFLVGWLVR